MHIFIVIMAMWHGISFFENGTHAILMLFEKKTVYKFINAVVLMLNNNSYLFTVVAV
jgi:hypothetical protein